MDNFFIQTISNLNLEMGKLISIRIENFKSYKGIHEIKFKDFTAIIGPNGSGKSNLMDAISFVLGIKSSQLRSSHLKELINHDVDSTASVSIVFNSEEQTTFTRTILKNGSSEYRINQKSVSFLNYVKVLEKDNILVKARNFLVFQGDVETVASQSPKDLTRLIEEISGSLELKEEYDRLKALQESATESSAVNFNKKRAINAEMKQFKERQAEAQRFDKISKKRVSMIN